MKIRFLRIVGLRCFEDTGNVIFHPKCNVIVGKNNTGKSTFLKAILGLQGFPFDHADIRPGHSASASVSVFLDQILANDLLHIARDPSVESQMVSMIYGGPVPSIRDHHLQLQAGQPLFPNQRPHHTVVPFLAKRKASGFDQNVSLGPQSTLNGTMGSLYGRIDLLATYGHPDHERFKEAVNEIVGLPITTRTSNSGKEAGFYFDRETFVTLDRMGDGVSEMVALIVELCAERNKIFVLEEPETNLHPRGLKALLSMVRAASEYNQFFVATHSNVVVRELGGNGDGKVIRIFRDGESYVSPSRVEEVERTPVAHMELLRELGYEFTDFDLFDAWLFLEESSAETVFREILIPNFTPDLRGRLRTYSAGGVGNLEPSVSEFQRLVVFIHLQPVYKDRLWIRADGDASGREAVEKIRAVFPHFKDELSVFNEAQFELYYPKEFQDRVKEVLAIEDKQSRRKEKAELLKAVLSWTSENKEHTIAEWKVSAREQIELLQNIQAILAKSN